MKIRSANPTDASQIAELNEVFVAVTSPMDAHRFLELFDLCSYCLVVDDGERLLGFVIAMRNEAPYDNGNYQWFESACAEHGLCGSHCAGCGRARAGAGAPTV